MRRKFAATLFAAVTLFVLIYARCTRQDRLEIIPVKSAGFPIDTQKTFGLSWASETLAEGNVYAGVLRSTDHFLCSTCNVDADFQKTHAYVWVLARKPVRLCVVGNKATVMCEGKNDRMYYVFPVDKKALRGVNEIVVTPE